MPSSLDTQLARWRRAGLIDAATADRIQSFESAQTSPARLRWPVVAALAAGGLMLGAGALLFVTAHWATLPPAARLTILLAALSTAHAAGAAAAGRFPALATTLHAVGTVILGAAIFLAGQTWNLESNWPQGFLLWAIGAWAGYLVLRSWPQLMAASLLTPIWLVAEWVDRVGHEHGRNPATPLAGLLLLALVYLHADARHRRTTETAVLANTGAFALIPLVLATVLFEYESGWQEGTSLGRGAWAFCWVVALGGPLAVAYFLRRQEAWLAVIAAFWVLVGVNLGRHPGVLPYLWSAAGCVGLGASGVYDASRRRINLSVAGFALTVVVFYFSSVLNKLGRSTSLLTGGLLFLALGWSLERLRRRLLVKASPTPS